MNQPRSPQTDNNSAVVINQDGKIEYHLNDDDTNSNHQHDSGTVDVKAAVIENELIPLTDAAQSFGRFLSCSRSIPYLILALILIILLMGQQIYSHSTSEVEHHQSQVVSQPTVPEESPAVTEIKVVAKLLYDDHKLNLSVLKVFNEKWQGLDDVSRQSLRGSFWFSRFSELLQDKIESQQANMQMQIAPDSVIVETASIIGMSLPEHVPADQDPDNSVDELFEDISSEIAKVEAEKVASTEKEIEPTELKPKPDEAKNTQGFFESDANYLLGQYVATYEFGKTNRLLSYFSADKKYRRRLKSSFKKVFAQSSKRRIIFSDLQWTFNEKSIVGKGKYQAQIKLKKNKGTRYVYADIKVKLKSQKEDLKIASLDFFNVVVDLKKASVKGKAKRKVAAKPKSKSAPKHKSASTQKANSKERPTTAELQDIVSRFALAYESGNITELDKIFSKDIKTNDKSSLRSVKQAYADLFKKTTDRQMFIEELNWSINNNSAKGVGKLSVLLISQSSSKISTQQGEIRIVAKKTNHETKITRMYQNLE